MDNIALLEAAKGGPFLIGLNGEVVTMPDPATLDFQNVLWALQNEHLPQTPKMLEWQRIRAFSAWAAHYDLPDFQSAQRLAYLLDKYRSAIVFDLHTTCGVDAGALWRARRWRTLLDLIDHLPGHSWYSAAVAGDEEHAKMLAESLVKRKQAGEESEPSGPSVNSWTPEVALLTQVLDAVRHNTYVLAAVNGNKGEPPKPSPTPKTSLDAAIKRAEHELRKARHESLVARVLRKKG